MQEDTTGFYPTYYRQQPDYSPLILPSVGILNRPANTPTMPAESGSQPPNFPTQPPFTPPPPRRPRSKGPLLLLGVVLAIVLGVGLFAAGWQFTVKSQPTKTTTATNSSSSSSSSSATLPVSQKEAAIAAVEPGVVQLNVTTAQGQQIGSGVIIDTKGDIVTNSHVVSGAQTIQVVISSGASLSAQLVGNDTADDLAVVHITPFAHMTVVPLGDSSKLVVGQDVLAIGNPLGITQTATNGIVSALNRSVTESSGATISNAIQTDAPINPGNSGGALINLQGQLIGIPTLGAVNTESNTPANGIGFAIPSSRVATVVQQMTNQG